MKRDQMAAPDAMTSCEAHVLLLALVLAPALWSCHAAEPQAPAAAPASGRAPAPRAATAGPSTPAAACVGVEVDTTPASAPAPPAGASAGVLVTRRWQDLLPVALEAPPPDASDLTDRRARELFLDGQVSEPLPAHFAVMHRLNSTVEFEVDVVNILVDGTLVVFHPGYLPGRNGPVFDCVDDAEAGAVLEGDVLHTTVSRSRWSARQGATTGDPSFDLTGDCEDAGRTVEDSFYSARSGRRLLAITRTSPTHAEPAVGLRVARSVARLAGPGCSAELEITAGR
jgi:hypothetical protein